VLPNHLPLFLSVVKAGSFSKAARESGISAAAVSKAIAALESTLDTRLFHRSTHSLVLTDEGRSFYKRIEPLVKQLEDQVSMTMDNQTQISGLIRINLPDSFGRKVIYPLLLDFAVLHPDIEFDLHFSDKMIDIVDNGFDIGIGNIMNRDSQLIGKKIYNLEFVTVAAPNYLKIFGEPKSIEDLKQHNCIAYRSKTSGQKMNWNYQVEGIQRIHAPLGSLSISNPELAIEAAEKELGITNSPYLHAKESLNSGRLTPILSKYSPPPIPMWIYYSSRRHLPLKTRHLIDFISEKLKK